MSKEFEDIVLNKLTALEENVQNNVLRKLDNLENEAKRTNTRLDNLEKEFREELGNLKIEVKDMGEVIQYLNNSFTRFDHEFNDRVNTLFDAFKVNHEKDSVHEENISSLNAKVFNHGVRISNLEDKVLIA